MAAEKKYIPDETAGTGHQAEAPAESVPSHIEDAATAERTDAHHSPARALQEQLHTSLGHRGQRGTILDTGRVLAAASGITTLLGVFVFAGIW